MGAVRAAHGHQIRALTADALTCPAGCRRRAAPGSHGEGGLLQTPLSTGTRICVVATLAVPDSTTGIRGATPMAKTAPAAEQTDRIGAHRDRQGRVAPRPARRQGSRRPLRPRRRPAAPGTRRPRLRRRAAALRHQRRADPRHRRQRTARADQGARHPPDPPQHPARRPARRAPRREGDRRGQRRHRGRRRVRHPGHPGHQHHRDRGRRHVDPRAADGVRRGRRDRHPVHRRADHAARRRHR